jgi:PEP-CTERM motif
MIRARLPLSFVFLAFACLDCRFALAESVPTEFQPKYDAGYESGYSLGYDLGLPVGKAKGDAEGSTKGHADGYTAGYGETYQPAFDHAYDAKYPIGNRAGWDAGVQDGFTKGYDWAPVIYQQWLVSGSVNACFSSITISGGLNWINSGSLDLFGRYSTILVGQNYDWGKHYFDIGYTDGKSAGNLMGSQDGYNLTYPLAYAEAYPRGQVDGIAGGIREGTAAGSASGYGDGYSAGQSTGYELGFTAGVQYHLFRQYARPVYALNYANRATGPAPVPEPSSWVLLGSAGFCALLRRRA